MYFKIRFKYKYEIRYKYIHEIVHTRAMIIINCSQTLSAVIRRYFGVPVRMINYEPQLSEQNCLLISLYVTQL